MMEESKLSHVISGKEMISENVCTKFSWIQGFAQYFYKLRNSNRARREFDDSQDVNVVFIDINDEDKKLFPSLTRYDYVMMLLSENDECLYFDYWK